MKIFNIAVTMKMAGFFIFTPHGKSKLYHFLDFVIKDTKSKPLEKKFLA